MASPTSKTSKNTKRIALITGANKGIGFETARQLGRQDIIILLGARDSAKGEAAGARLRSEGLDVRALQIDVASEQSIRRAVEVVAKDFSRLDILINNAGVMLDEPDQKVSGQSLATWCKTFETNVFGLIATTQAFLPLLRQSEAGRIVNLSSILGSNTLHNDPQSPIYHFKLPAYNVSKSAVNAYTVQLAYELRDTPIKVNAAHPGWVKTEMGGEGATMELPDGAKTSIALATLSADGPNGTYVHQGEVLPW